MKKKKKKKKKSAGNIDRRQVFDKFDVQIF